MKTKNTAVDPLELALFKAMIAVIVRRPDGLSVIESALECVFETGVEMGVFRTAADSYPLH